jgi:hypothetical protein
MATRCHRPGRSYPGGLRCLLGGGVSARNSVTLRDLHVFVDGSAELVAPDDLDVGGVGGIGLGECS